LTDPQNISGKGLALKAALTYAQRGWAVFPCQPRTKLPATKNGVLDATTDAATIREWWVKWPNANVAIATGRSGLVVIDVDGPEGEAALVAWQAQNGAFPISPIGYTGGGGRHFLFKANEEPLIPGTHILGKGSHVDIRAGESYIIAPPSIHPNGTTYEWDAEAHPAQVELPNLPPALLSKLLSKNAEKPSNPLENSDELISAGQDEYGARRAAVLARKGFSKDEARGALGAMIETRFEGGWGGLDPRRPWAAVDIERWLKGAYEKFYDPDSDPTDLDAIQDLMPGATLPTRSEIDKSVHLDDIDDPGESWPEYRGDVLAAMDEVELNWLPVLGEPGWVVKGWSHLLSGFVRSGKTEFLARSVQQWLAEGQRVYWLTEESPSMWTLRLRELPGDEWERLIVRPAMGMAVKEMRETAMAAESGIVIVDSIRNLLRIKDENDNAEMAGAAQPWVMEARRAGKTLILTHHARKSGGEHGEGVAGGSGLISVIDVILEVNRDSTAENWRVLSNVARVVPHKREVYEMDLNTGEMAFLTGTVEGLQRQNVQNRVEAIFAATGESLTAKDLPEHLQDPRPNDFQIRQALDGLVKAGRLIQERVGGHSVRYRRGLILGLSNV